MKKPIKLLEILLNGQEVIKDNKTWVIHNGRFGIKSKKYVIDDNEQIGKEEDVVLFVDMSIDVFLIWADKFSEDEIFNYLACKLLNEINRDGGLTAWTLKQNK